MKYFISGSDFHYSRILLFSWECDSDPTTLSETNGKFFSSKVLTYANETGCDKIVINSNNVVDIDDHFLDSIQDCFKVKGLELFFYSNDGSDKLVNYIGDHFDKEDFGVDKQLFTEGNAKVVCLSRKNNCSSSVFLLVNEATVIESRYLKKVVAESYVKNDCGEVLSSTPLIPTGNFNATDIISSPDLFRWIVLLLVEMIDKVIQKERPKKYTIVASSLRGAAIAGTVKELLHFLSGPDLCVFDHIGPNHDVLEQPLFSNLERSEYCVYVGDFLIGGTELKITQAYCGFFGGFIKHAFVIGKYTENKMLGNAIELHGLVQLKDCVTDLSYKLG